MNLILPRAYALSKKFTNLTIRYVSLFFPGSPLHNLFLFIYFELLSRKTVKNSFQLVKDLIHTKLPHDDQITTYLFT